MSVSFFIRPLLNFTNFSHARPFSLETHQAGAVNAASQLLIFSFLYGVLVWAIRMFHTKLKSTDFTQILYAC